MQVSIPNANTSIFIKPSASISSLFHSMQVRFSIRAFITGTKSLSLPRVITNPPVCCPSCRGNPINSFVSCNTLRRCKSPGLMPCSCNLFPSNHSSVNSQMEELNLLMVSTDKPIAFPTSLMAPLWCCCVTVAIIAARSLPYFW